MLAMVRVAARRYRHVLVWLEMLLRVAKGHVMSTMVYLDPGVWDTGYAVFVDASPWGGGGFLMGPRGPLEYFATAWTAGDERQLRMTIGSPRHQATMEALAVLVAVRVWRAVWVTRPTVIRIRSDSTAALAMAEKLRSNAPGMNRVARERAVEAALSP